MLEYALNHLKDYASLPLRAVLGSVFTLHGYSHIALGITNITNFILPIIFLFCGLSILFGFFTRLACLTAIFTMTAFGLVHLFIVVPNFVDLYLDNQALTAAASLTLVFMDNGKLSLENYFGFK